MKTTLFTLITILSIIIIMFFTKEEDKYINTSGEASNDKKVDLLKHIEHSKEKIIPITKEQKPSIRNILESKDSNIDEESPEKMEELKKIHNLTFDSIHKELKKIPLCLENIKTKEEAIACTKDLVLLQSSIPLSFDIESNHEMKSFFSKWNKDSKVNILDELEIISFQLKELEECINAAVTKVNKRECLKQQDIDTWL